MSQISYQCGKQTCQCDGGKAKYYYDVGNNTDICDEVYYTSECQCDTVFASDFPDPLNNDGLWYECYICDVCFVCDECDVCDVRGVRDVVRGCI